MGRKFQGIWIPSSIWLNKEMSIQAKCLWAEIQSLHSKEKGGCFASNEYLCDFMGIKTRRLQELLSYLKRENLLEQRSFDGRQRVLVALSPPSDDVKEGCGKVHGAGAEKCTADVHDPAPPSYSDSKAYSKAEVHTPKPPFAGSDHPSGDAAAAPLSSDDSRVDKNISPSKKGKAKKQTEADFSPELRELYHQFVVSMLAGEPSWRPVKDPVFMLKALKSMLDDGHAADEIIETLQWGLQDDVERDGWNGWKHFLINRQPVTYLHTKYAKIRASMKTSPKKEVDRRTMVDGKPQEYEYEKLGW